jgi:hypothetical protein
MTWTAQVSSGRGVAAFLVADLVAGQPVPPPSRHLGLGLDSWVARLIHAFGEWGLLVVSG